MRTNLRDEVRALAAPGERGGVGEIGGRFPRHTRRDGHRHRMRNYGSKKREGRKKIVILVRDC